MKKNTSTQVQTVLKYIISQNPLNAAANTSKSQVVKAPAPIVVKSSSKQTVISTATSTTVTAKQTTKAVPLTDTSRNQVSNTANTTDEKTKSENSTITNTKVVSTHVVKVSTVPVKSESQKPNNAVSSGGGKPSMLLGLLGGNTESQPNQTTTYSPKQAKLETGSEEMKSEEDKKLKSKPDSEEVQDEAHNVDDTKKADLEPTKVGSTGSDDKQTEVVEEVEEAGDDVEKMEVNTVAPNSETTAPHNPLSELVCEESMPESTVPKEKDALVGDFATEKEEITTSQIPITDASLGLLAPAEVQDGSCENKEAPTSDSSFTTKEMAASEALSKSTPQISRVDSLAAQAKEQDLE